MNCMAATSMSWVPRRVGSHIYLSAKNPYILLGLVLLVVSACSQYQYVPRRLATGELSIRADRLGTEFYTENNRVIASSFSGYVDLEDFVSCVPRATVHARHAKISYIVGSTLTGVTAAFGLATSLLLGNKMYEHSVWAGVVTAISLGGSLSLRHRALGHAVDAMNYYNDQVGSLGATCREPTYVTPQPLDSDSDGDGIVDRLDLCPHQKGLAESDGCAPKVFVLKPPNVSLQQQVRFATGKADILPAAAELLDEVAEQLKIQPRLHVHIQGHSDTSGKAAEDQFLSEARARAVMRYLIGQNVEADRLSAAGYGVTRPLCKESLVSCQEINRRVDFVVVPQ